MSCSSLVLLCPDGGMFGKSICGALLGLRGSQYHGTASPPASLTVHPHLELPSMPPSTHAAPGEPGLPPASQLLPRRCGRQTSTLSRSRVVANTAPVQRRASVLPRQKGRRTGLVVLIPATYPHDLNPGDPPVLLLPPVIPAPYPVYEAAGGLAFARHNGFRRYDGRKTKTGISQSTASSISIRKRAIGRFCPLHTGRGLHPVLSRGSRASLRASAMWLKARTRRKRKAEAPARFHQMPFGSSLSAIMIILPQLPVPGSTPTPI